MFHQYHCNLDITRTPLVLLKIGEIGYLKEKHRIEQTFIANTKTTKKKEKKIL